MGKIGRGFLQKKKKKKDLGYGRKCSLVLCDVEINCK